MKSLRIILLLLITIYLVGCKSVPTCNKEKNERELPMISVKIDKNFKITDSYLYVYNDNDKNPIQKIDLSYEKINEEDIYYYLIRTTKTPIPIYKNKKYQLVINKYLFDIKDISEKKEIHHVMIGYRVWCVLGSFWVNGQIKDSFDFDIKDALPLDK